MVTDKIAKLKEIEAKALELKAAIEAERKAELPTLHVRYGFENLNAFIKALKAASAGQGKGRKARAPKAAKPAKTSKRVKITPELKEQVRAAVVEGKTGSEIVKAFGISLPSVQNIKREFGLVKPRGEAAPAAEAAPAPAV